MRRVLVHRPAAAEAEVADDDPRRLRVRGPVAGQHRDDRPDRALVTVEPCREVRGRVRARVPRDPVGPLDRELRAVDETAGVLEADGRGAAPLRPRPGLRPSHRLGGFSGSRNWNSSSRNVRLGGSSGSGTALRAASMPKRADREHRGRAEDERHRRNGSRGQPAPPRRLGLEPATTRCVEPRLRGAEARKLRYLERAGRPRQRKPAGASRLLAEPEDVRLQPFLAGSPAHGHTSFARTAACPPPPSRPVRRRRRADPASAVRPRSPARGR